MLWHKLTGLVYWFKGFPKVINRTDTMFENRTLPACVVLDLGSQTLYRFGWKFCEKSCPKCGQIDSCMTIGHRGPVACSDWLKYDIGVLMCWWVIWPCVMRCCFIWQNICCICWKRCHVLYALHSGKGAVLTCEQTQCYDLKTLLTNYPH